MLSSYVILAQHPRQFFSAKPSRSRCLCFRLFSRPSSKSLPFNSFADPHPLTTIESYLYKNMGRRGVRGCPRITVHSCFKSFSCNTYGPPRKCCKQKTYGLAKPFRCNTYKKPGGGPAFRRSDVPTFERFPSAKASTHLRAIIGFADCAAAKKASQE